MTFPRDRHEAVARIEVRESLAASGIPAEHIEEIVELGFEAAHRARAALHDTVFSAEDERVAITALGVAISVAINNLQTLQAAMVETAEAAGRPVRRFTVGGVHGRDH
ncbi:hypothetical protein LH128_01814 [Sphingomonas sp. LH128]|uniref:hypothetical protein n=1 Tax=Sphingomonas sp. LH128 TaxID=473781 RepID=UPI00027C96C4|nr:hypothetical protein [Sphingomonas sp. LH128]EJU14800.1 hypothetical protein LH128_01814 [Sphingomonas sp. LH128]